MWLLVLLDVLVVLLCCGCLTFVYIIIIPTTCIIVDVLWRCLYMEDDWHLVIVYGVGMHELGHWDYVTVLSQYRYQLILTSILWFRPLFFFLSIPCILCLSLHLFASPLALLLYTLTPHTSIPITNHNTIQMTRVHNNLFDLFYLRLQHMIKLFATTVVIITTKWW